MLYTAPNIRKSFILRRIFGEIENNHVLRMHIVGLMLKRVTWKLAV